MLPLKGLKGFASSLRLNSRVMKLKKRRSLATEICGSLCIPIMGLSMAIVADFLLKGWRRFMRGCIFGRYASFIFSPAFGVKETFSIGFMAFSFFVAFPSAFVCRALVVIFLLPRAENSGRTKCAAALFWAWGGSPCETFSAARLLAGGRPHFVPMTSLLGFLQTLQNNGCRLP